jgi:amidophosphoribosyltransferase
MRRRLVKEHACPSWAKCCWATCATPPSEGDSLENCHPRRRLNNWITRNLVVAGNFNMTNVDELFDLLVSIGQHPKERSDTMTVLEKIGHFLDVENDRQLQIHRQLGYTDKQITPLIGEKMDVRQILVNSAVDFDGGYALAGMMGHGDAFVLRDPSGIRPAFWYADDEWWWWPVSAPPSRPPSTCAPRSATN